ncbi:eCIS core domain-containing protein [Crossiella cryophila]|uniref:eCIS core domain-containing protein n=1 Tax=Crossiella cryophila TaxID=43355 RepID=A0A7W7CB43_9PSEU|nr:DUF4157 domain-containing protein [Crossiella cryophila]MBB4677907.1 hypothetical protein [Crossiella cryophila]
MTRAHQTRDPGTPAVTSHGRPLEPVLRHDLEARFDADFSQVRVHTGPEAAAAANALDARAYTVGQHIVFGAEDYRPSAMAGRGLLAHELAHTLQQGNAQPTPGLPVSRVSDHAEGEARSAVEAVAEGRRPIVRSGQSPVLARQTKGEKPKPVPKKKTAEELAAEAAAKQEALDAKAREFGAADYADYRSKLVGGTVFGVAIAARGPVHPRFLRKLKQVEADALAANGGADLGVRSVLGYYSGGMHTWGRAVDLNLGRNVYVTHSNGEQGISALVDPVYDRIARRMLNRASALVHGVRKIAVDTGLVAPGKAPSRDQEFELIAQENDAMIDYFAAIRTEDPKIPARRVSRTVLTTPLTPEDPNIEQIRRDFDLLRGVGQPVFGDKDYPFQDKTGGGQVDRTPHGGFLDLPRELVNAARARGLRWGGTDFGPESGDMMHLDDKDHSAEYRGPGNWS